MSFDYKNIPTLHIDGSLSEYEDNSGDIIKIGGVGGYLMLNGKVIDKFHKTLKNIPYLDRHEDYAVIEGLNWVKNKGVSAIKIKTDSLTTVNLFNGHKKATNKEEKFFLAQFLILEFLFELVEISYYSRNEDDIAHEMSRMYMKEIPKGVKKIKTANHKETKEDALIKELEDRENAKFLISTIKNLI